MTSLVLSLPVVDEAWYVGFGIVVWVVWQRYRSVLRVMKPGNGTVATSIG